MVGALANGKAGLADFPRLRGKHIHARDGTRRVSAEHRAQNSPARNPSGRNCTRPNATSRRPAIHEPIIHTNISPRQRGTPPRRPTPARTIPSAGAKTGQTQHFVGAQFTDSQSGISSLRASAEQRRKRKPRRSPAPRFRISNSGLPPRQTQKIPPHPYGRSGICECDYFATVRAVTWGLAPSYQ